MPAGSLVAASRPRAFFLGGARLPGGRVRGAGVRGASVRGAPPRVVRAVVDPERDTILVAGCKERVAQCSVDQLSKNARSAGTRVVAILPGSCYEGVRNPLDAMAKDLLYPDRPMIDCLSALDAGPGAGKVTTVCALCRALTLVSPMPAMLMRSGCHACICTGTRKARPL